MTVAAQLRSMVHDSDLSQKDLAIRMECSDAYVSDMLRGNRRVTPLFLDKILAALGIGKSPLRTRLHHEAAREAGWGV